MGTGLLLGAVSVFVILMLLTISPGAREGSYRRGHGWYLDARSSRAALVPGAQPGSQFERTSLRSIRLWVTGGIVLTVLGLVAWLAFDQILAGAVSALMGLLLLGLAWDGIRRNRQVDRFDPPDGEA